MGIESTQSHGISAATSHLLSAMGMKFGMNEAALDSLLDRIIDECDNLDQMSDRLGVSLKSTH